MGDVLSVFAIGFAGCFIAVATHITFNSLYACLFASNFIARARVGVGALFLLTSLANFAQYLSLGDFGCMFAAKWSIVTFHLQMLSGEAFQMYRISVITGRNRLFLGFAVVLLLLRGAVMISDIVLSTSSASDQGGCTFVQELYSGVLHVAMDAIVELFITTAITIALVQHTQELKRLHRGSSSTSLYKIIIETNIFRTALLFLINLFTMLVIMNDPHSVVLTYMWSLMGIVYLYFVIYDKGMVRFLHQLASSTKSSIRRITPNEISSLSSVAPLQVCPAPQQLNLPDDEDAFPATIDEWADQYFSHLDTLNSRSNFPRQPPMNIAIV